MFPQVTCGEKLSKQTGKVPLGIPRWENIREKPHTNNNL
jgi:hypothetical protein